MPPGFQNAQIFQVPAKSIIALSTTHLPFLDELGLLSHLKAISQKQYVNNPNVWALIRKGQVIEVGPPTGLDIEKILQINPSIFMVTGTSNPKRDGFAKLFELGIPVVANIEHMEKTPLATTEWVKFIALFFNKEAQATRLFNQTLSRYQQLAQKVKQVKYRPTVFTGAPYKGVWYVPGGDSSTAYFLRDAGANYLWGNNTIRINRPIDIETVLVKAANADFWINTGIWKSIDDALSTDLRYQNFEALHQGHAYNNNAKLSNKNGNDYWETGLAHPELVLADLVKIFHPELLPDHELIWYHALK